MHSETFMLNINVVAQANASKKPLISRFFSSSNIITHHKWSSVVSYSQLTISHFVILYGYQKMQFLTRKR